MIRGERVYRAFLRAYPSRFLRAYEREMLLVFRDQRREGSASGASRWIALLMDVVRSAPREWYEELTHKTQTGGRPMRGFALVSMLVAAFELINAAVEVQGGGFSGRDALSQATLVVTMLSMVALFVAGFRLMRAGREAAPLAAMAAAACIASFAFIGLARPVYSVFSMLVGIGFPITLLVWLMVNGRGAPAAGARNIG